MREAGRVERKPVMVKCLLFFLHTRILMFENAMKEKERPKGVAPKRTLDSLP